MTTSLPMSASLQRYPSMSPERFTSVRSERGGKKTLSFGLNDCAPSCMECVLQTSVSTNVQNGQHADATVGIADKCMRWTSMRPHASHADTCGHGVSSNPVQAGFSRFTWAAREQESPGSDGLRMNSRCTHSL